MLWMISNGCRPVLPKEHLDLWTWFLEGARGCIPFGVKVVWIKGHVNWPKSFGLQKVHAWFNHWADRTAGAASHWVAQLPVYQSFVQRFFRQRRLARWVHEYQSRVAFVFASKDVVEVCPPVEVTIKEGVGPFFSVSEVCLEDCAVSHVGFASKLVSWLSNLKWYTGSVGREESDLSWLELFWGFIHDTLVLPPFRYGGRWVTLDDDVAFSFVLPSLKVLFRTWRCCVDALVRGGGCRCRGVRFRLLHQFLSWGRVFCALVFLVTLFCLVRRSLTCPFSLLGLGAWLIFGSLLSFSCFLWIPGPQKPACLVSGLTS